MANRRENMDWIIEPKEKSNNKITPQDSCIGHVCWSHDGSACTIDHCTGRVCLAKHCLGNA